MINCCSKALFLRDLSAILSITLLCYYEDIEKQDRLFQGVQAALDK